VTTDLPIAWSSTSRIRPAATFLSIFMFSAIVPAGSDRTSVRNPNVCSTRSIRSTSAASIHPSRCETSAASSIPAATASPCSQVL
jgi:hypothetical protein